MAINTSGQKPFPAVVIVCVLFLACLFAGQRWIGPLLPGFTGLATINPGLIIIDIPVSIPVTIDLVLLPALLLLTYTFVILVYPVGQGVSSGQVIAHRFKTFYSGLFIFLFCVALGALASWQLQSHLPRSVANGLDSLGIDADASMRGKALHLHGDILCLFGVIIGIALFFGKINKAPVLRKITQLTREQRMTPYARMLQEKREQAKAATPPRATPTVKNPASKKSSGRAVNRQPPPVHSSRPLCYNQPLLTLEPEAVNYRPI